MLGTILDKNKVHCAIDEQCSAGGEVLASSIPKLRSSHIFLLLIIFLPAIPKNGIQKQTVVAAMCYYQVKK